MDNALERIQSLVRERGYDANFSDLGHIYTQTTRINDKGLVLFNYNPLAMIENTWNEYEVICRGLILDEQGEIVARPFEKFFNFMQNDMTPELISSIGIKNITEKADGSLGILFWLEDEWRIATRGSFSSDQAKKAAEMLGKYNLDALTKYNTYLVEIIYPENRIVLDYQKQEDLILITAFDPLGHEHDRLELEFCAALSNMPIVSVVDMSLDSLINAMKAEKGMEGWVVLLNNGVRVKFKTEDYKALHKLIGNITEKAVFEAWANGGIEAYMSAIPDEFLDGVKEFVSNLNYFKSKLNADYSRIYLAITNIVQMITDHTDSTNMRKEFALLALRFKHSDLLFAMLTNQDIYKVIVKTMSKDLSQYGSV